MLSHSETIADLFILFIYLFTMFTEDCPVSNITILSRGPPLKCIKDKNIDYIQNVYT